MPRLRGHVEALANAILTTYFELSYRLMDSATGRALLETASEPGAPPVHGYTDLADLRVLVESLKPNHGSSVLDLGAGLGDVAIWLHQATGARVIGVERSRRAVTAAHRQAAAAGVGDGVRFVVGDVMRGTPPASAAYALDSLMFARRPTAAIATAAIHLQPHARLFATVIVVGRSSPASLHRSLVNEGLGVVRLEDVSVAMAARSRRRRVIAMQLARARPWTIADRGSLVLVWVEETMLFALVRAGLARRYRVVVEAKRGR